MDRIFNVLQLAQKHNLNMNTVQEWIRKNKLQPHFFSKSKERTTHFWVDDGSDKQLESLIKKAKTHRQHLKFRKGIDSASKI